MNANVISRDGNTGPKPVFGDPVTISSYITVICCFSSLTFPSKLASPSFLLTSLNLYFLPLACNSSGYLCVYSAPTCVSFLAIVISSCNLLPLVSI